jgi:hypothetical protein
MDAERGLFLKTVAVGTVLFSKIEQFKGIRGVGQVELDNHFPDPIDFIRPGAHHEALFDQINTGDDHLLALSGPKFNDTEAAAAVGFKFFMITERGDIDSSNPGGLKNRHSLLGSDFLTIYL